MAEYVAGALSALFGRKSSFNNAEGSEPVKLTHVKQMYEEFKPRKAPTKVGKELGDQQVQFKKQDVKRKLAEGKSSEAAHITAKKGRFVYALPQTEKLNERTPKACETLKSPRKGMSNKEAALFRINKKKAKSETIEHDSGDIKVQKRTKKEQDSELKETAKHKDTDKVKSEGVENEEDNKRNFCYYEDDPTYIPRTIFVKNLPPKTRRKQIKEIFGKCGDILFVRFTNAIPAKSSIPAEAAVKKRSLIKEGTTICSYVVFADINSVTAALSLNGIEFEGHHLRVDRREASTVPPKRSVFCGNIPFDVTDDELWEFFGEAGQIDYVRVIRDSITGNGKGIAFVVFKESSAAMMALEFSGKVLKNRTIRVTAIEKKKQSGDARGTVAASKNIQMGGSKERINKKKMERKSQQQERKQKGLKKCAGKFGKQKREKLKKSIKKEKTSKFKKNLARKLQGMS